MNKQNILIISMILNAILIIFIGYKGVSHITSKMITIKY